MKNIISETKKKGEFDFLLISFLLSINLSILYIPFFFKRFMEDYYLYNSFACMMVAVTCAVVFLVHRGTSFGIAWYSKSLMSLFFSLFVFFSFRTNLLTSFVFIVAINFILALYWDCINAGKAVPGGRIAVAGGLAGFIAMGASGYGMIDKILEFPIIKLQRTPELQ